MNDVDLIIAGLVCSAKLSNIYNKFIETLPIKTRLIVEHIVQYSMGIDIMCLIGDYLIINKQELTDYVDFINNSVKEDIN